MLMEGLVWSLVSGAVGGNLAGALMKAKSLGTLWNTVVGVLGGGIGGQILGALGLLQGAGVAGNIGASTVGGALLLWVVSLFKKASA
jgi:uncharacterized membrane protein YeaQ/YmgE (transglycosylase-associated protein family)